MKLSIVRSRENADVSLTTVTEISQNSFHDSTGDPVLASYKSRRVANQPNEQIQIKRRHAILVNTRGCVRGDAVR